jgi:hypothetical protein
VQHRGCDDKDDRRKMRRPTDEPGGMVAAGQSDGRQAKGDGPEKKQGGDNISSPAKSQLREVGDAEKAMIK